MSWIPFTRRRLLGGAAASAIALGTSWKAAPAQKRVSFNLLRQPDLLRIQNGDDATIRSAGRQGDRWSVAGAEVTCTVSADDLSVTLEAPAIPVQRVHLRWQSRGEERSLVLGDAWERSYGELAWLPLRPDRVLPWYFLLSSMGGVEGAGVRVQPAALAFWQVDVEGVSLWLDVRNGGDGVLPGQRTLPLASVVQQAGSDPWQTSKALCRKMVAKETVVRRRGPYALDAIYGSNDWYYAYGRNTPSGILRDADLMRELAPSGPHRPFCVIDDGYQDPARFPDMARLAEEIRRKQVAPGVWIRPLRAAAGDPAKLMLPAKHWAGRSDEQVFDPTIPEARERVLQVVRQACAWGFDFIKHDFTTYELLGQWGSGMGASPTRPGWAFHDRSRTNAEIIRSLYADIRSACGQDRVILGCNTVGHLSVGLFDASRTGDDVSGRDWERTRRMGVNTLAFRLPQNGTFFLADADCVPVTSEVDWKHTEEWLRLVASSGTVLLVSPDPGATGAPQKAAIRAAFAALTSARELQPLDWTASATPSHWKTSAGPVTFDWLDAAGASPFNS